MLKIKFWGTEIGWLDEGDLKVKFEKLGKKFERFLNSDRNYISSSGKAIRLHGRALLLNRNVGHLMKTPSVLFSDKIQIPEGILDAFITSAACLHDLNKKEIQELDLFTLLNQKCMVRRKWHLQMKFFQKLKKF